MPCRRYTSPSYHILRCCGPKARHAPLGANKFIFVESHVEGGAKSKQGKPFWGLYHSRKSLFVTPISLHHIRTNFSPIISSIESYRENNQSVSPSSILPIILTDGYAPLDLDYDINNPLLWVISPGGLPSGRFPYGDVTRISQ